MAGQFTNEDLAAMAPEMISQLLIAGKLDNLLAVPKPDSRREWSTPQRPLSWLNGASDAEISAATAAGELDQVLGLDPH